MSIDLPNKPLVEALLEFQWALIPDSMGGQKDPAYPIVVGRLQERVREDYPVIETLPTTRIPDELTPYIAKYRFRQAEGEWPLIQVGPGIASLNYTKSYTWERFRESARSFYPKLIDAYSIDEGVRPPRFNSILLRYLNGIAIDPQSEDLLGFLASQLNTSIVLPDAILARSQIGPSPSEFHLNLTFPLEKPAGFGTLLLATGKYDEIPALILDLNVRVTGDDVPQDAASFEHWLSEAHLVVETWFFTLIRGNLEQQFRETSDDSRS